MIDGITSSGPYIRVTNGLNYGTGVFISPNSNNPMTGMVRVNGNQFEAFDGTGWVRISASVADVGLNESAVTAITWAQEKMFEESKLKMLAQSHPAIADAVSKLEKTMDEIKVLVALTEKG